ncbi:phosphoethanolamine transferase [Hydrogenophaga sp.]|uniref:phosphoethanolamine transferase n=1 Tax=Hydrogenophaga sp. TaxID=1904254 RepID=UPI002732B90E|nr:phosphoethanolamine--lipid A transferase [Hydrogenophaga sp.]MDP3350003.1 phosphoethanolamine--lipid A transferase [Hydrogenophaga sp.]MDZ4396518.1 phosphoethanolamine--lipid A transferase [Hydrogenophaga sp.]
MSSAFSPAPSHTARLPAPTWRPATAVWLLSLWLAVAGNLPLWLRVNGLVNSPMQGLALFAGFGVVVLGITAALLSLLAWPRVFRPVATVLVLVSAFNTHFMLQYGAVIDPTMLANVVQTDVREVRDLMSWALPLTVLLVAGLPLWVVWRRPLAVRSWLPQTGRNALGALIGVVAVVAATLITYQDLASLMRNHKELRYMVNPVNTVYAASRLAVDQLPRQVQALKPVGKDARLGASYAAQARPPLLMLVIGETARAQNFGLNGYVRNTTPALARWQAEEGLVNFSQVQSCGTNTKVSVPCMFSPLTRTQGGDQTPEHENLLDVLQRAGLAVLWLDNQAGCKGVCARVPNASTLDLKLPGLCDGGECLDPAMLVGLDERIAALDPVRRARGVVLVMHQMGSHGPAYFKRSAPDRKPFMPECTSNTLSDCPPEELVNGYDNSIAATDHFLDLSLQWLKATEKAGAFQTGLIYLSDHGESLGESGLYLHGLPYAMAPQQQTHVPMVAWLSPGLQQRSGVGEKCLRAQADKPLSHDNLFHSVLGLMDVQTQAHELALDMLAPCATAYAQLGAVTPPEAN